jgi:hypothetical protein
MVLKSVDLESRIVVMGMAINMVMAHIIIAKKRHNLSFLVSV